MFSITQCERLALSLTTFLSLLCLIGLWALVSLPSQRFLAVHAFLASEQFAQDEALIAANAPSTVKDLPETSVSSYKLPNWLPSASKAIVDPALLAAIIKHESNFNPNARSHAGATGLMQLMPETADYVIRRYRLNEIKVASLDMPKLPKPISAARLANPEVNITVGQHYIKYLSDKSYIEGNIIYLLAAYNAGPGNLIVWQNRFAGVQDPREFIRSIPFKETRHYVQKVLRSYIAYQMAMTGESPIYDALQEGKWPTLPAGAKL